MNKDFELVLNVKHLSEISENDVVLKIAGFRKDYNELDIEKDLILFRDYLFGFLGHKGSYVYTKFKETADKLTMIEGKYGQVILCFDDIEEISEENYIYLVNIIDAFVFFVRHIND